MNEKHFTTEEMARLINAKTLDDEMITFAAALNRHLLQCDSCLACYQDLLSLHDMAANGQPDAPAHTEREPQLTEDFALSPLSDGIDGRQQSR